jgi:hypothetical protein
VAFSGCLYIPPVLALLQELLVAIHGDVHEGIQRTLHCISRDFHSPNMRATVQKFVHAYDVCQHNKSEHLHPTGLLLLLPVLLTVWADIALDFVKALPRVNGKSIILTVALK